MASVAHYTVLDPALPHKRGKSCPCASLPVQKHTSSLVFTGYCSGRNGVRLTIAKTADRESIEFAQSAYQIDLLPFAEPIEIQETANVELEKEGMEMKKRIEIIKNMFRSQRDGEISVSPYDTAWVARVSALDGSGEPQFPSCLQWIIENQLPDGSWGDSRHFHVGDRILNTLSCVIALKTWNVANDAVNKGLRFLQRYILKINAEDDVNSLIAFEIIFPSLMEDAKAMNIDLPYDDDILHQVYAERDLKMKRIPMDVLHNSPSTLLHSLEGLRDVVDWDKLQEFQSKDGSFLFSPASTAYALIQTSDVNCARYLAKTIKIHNGGVPITYPVDIFEHLWMVDRLERLGIARYFEKEITDNLDYVYRYWTNKGVGWARDSSIQDVDDTSMAFRLLRLHGFNVSSEVFSHFKQGDQFICFEGQVSQAVTGIYNLYRASQIMFPGESILQEAKLFSKNFLEDKRAKNQINDKWIISKGLAGEVGYALDFPWYASQPRIETRMYIEQYGTDDIWIGKSLYRMPFVNNTTYIDLARADFKFCQSIHRKELDVIIRWSSENRFQELGLEQDSIIRLYFLSAVALFEPEKAASRIAWAHSSILMTAVQNLFSGWHSSPHKKCHFVNMFQRWDVTRLHEDIPQSATRLLTCMFQMIKMFCMDGSVAQGRDISDVLINTWQTWLAKEAGKEEDVEVNGIPEAEVIVMSASFFDTEVISPDSICRPEFIQMIKLTNTVCSLLRVATHLKEKWTSDRNVWVPAEEEKLIGVKQRADEAMKELVRAVHEGERGVPSMVKRMCMSVSKSFYYSTHCSNEEMDDHVNMVLFKPVE